MNIVKKILWSIMLWPPLMKLIIRLALWLHNWSYKIVGMLSSVLEPDRLHPKHRLMKYHDWFLQHIQQDWHVLDVGCGNGALAYDLKDRCASVFAIDLNPQNIARATMQFPKAGVVYVQGDATTYPFDQTFDAIVLSNVLEHIEHRVEFLKRLYASQNQGNPPILLLRVPMITRDWITLYKKEQGVEWRLDPTHWTEYTIEQITEELARAGLRIRTHEIMFGEFYGVIDKI